MISIIITALNERKLYLDKTLESLIPTLKENDEIIVIDDCSDIPIVIDNKNIKLERNIFRLGVAQSRHIGATFAKNKWLLFTDAHVYFKSDWRENFIKYQENSNENTIYNGACLGLWEDSFDYDNLNLDKLPNYYGARLSLYEEKENQILEGKWIDEKKNIDNYNISCLMGAIYFIQRKFFFKIRGLSDLRMWGSDEPLLSIKTLLCGGEIKQLKNIKAAHVFRGNAPYSTYIKHLLYNKIRMIGTLLPDELSNKLLQKLSQNKDLNEAFQLINNESKIIQEYKNYYKSIFTENIYDICKKYNISIDHI